MVQRLCNACKSFNLHSFSLDTFALRGYPFKAVREAATAECNFCSYLLSTFRDFLASSESRYKLPLKWEEEWYVHFKLIREAGTDEGEENSGGLRVSRLCAILAEEGYSVPFGFGAFMTTSNWSLIAPAPWPELRDRPHLELIIAADPDTAAIQNKDVVHNYPGEDTNSPEHLELIKKWLAKCLQHPECCRPMSGLGPSIVPSESLLPARCIDTSEAPNRLRLFEFHNQKPIPSGSYITLSHRWGPETYKCRTTTENLESRTLGLRGAFGSLPKTFLDAICLARNLNIRYIWIDSICIIQEGDSGADCKKELVKMAQYYQGALFTIAATSNSLMYGLFPPREITAPVFARLPYRDKNNLQQGFMYLYSADMELNRRYRETVIKSEILTRGWVFQEWNLSRRIVNFTPLGLFFHCQSKNPQSDRNDEVQIFEWRMGTIDDRRTRGTSIVESWYSMISEYSALSFTSAEKDRLNALEGITGEFRKGLIFDRNLALRLKKSNMRLLENRPDRLGAIEHGSEGAAGLFFADIQFGLLWQQAGESKPTLSNRLSNFPTWSWASFLGRVTWEGLQRHHRHHTADLIGYVAAPSLGIKLRSWLIPVEVGGGFNRAEEKVVKQLTKSERRPSLPGWRKVCSLLRRSEVAGWSSIEHGSFQDDVTFQSGMEILAFPISTVVNDFSALGLGYWSLFYPIYDVLFLRRSRDGYERVGVGVLFGKDFEKQVKHAVKQDILLV